MKQISANITGSFILNGTDLTNTLGSSSIWSGSFSTRVSDLESFSSSLDATFATDAQLAAVSASLNSYTASNNTVVNNLSAATASLNTFTGSAASRLGSIETTTGSLNAFTSSADGRLGSLEVTSGSNITRISALEVASGSAITRLSALEVASGSAINRLSSLETASGSAITRLGALETASGSAISRLNSIESTTGSLNAASGSAITRLNALEVASGSAITRLNALEVASGSAINRLSSLETASGSAINRLSALEIASGSAISRLNSLETASGSAISRLNSLEVTSGSNITRLTNLENKTGSYATTGSNTFVGGAYFSSSFNPVGFTTTASLYTDGGLRVTKDAYISGTLYLNNVTVFGTQSVAYISSSQLNIGTNIITVNTDTPSVRFGGLAVYDSGSTGLTGSLLWDSQNNHWVYSNPSGSTYSGGMFISGPRTATLGSEQGTTNCMLLAGQGGDHLTSSMIYHSSTTTCIPTAIVGGSTACFASNVCVGGGLVVQQASTFGNTVGLFGASPQLYIGATSGVSDYVILGWCSTNKSLNIRNQSVGNSGQLVITCEGNIVIGDQTALGSKLTIVSANDQAGITMYNTYDCNKWSLRTGTSGINNKGFGIVDDICNLTRIQIDGAGNVGIGTLSPAYKLDVSADINDGSIIRAINTNSGAAATARVYVENNIGSFGQLTTYSSGFGFNVFDIAAGNFTALLSSGASSAGLLAGTLTSDPMIFGTNNTERMRITCNGNIGIGTTDTQTFKLAVDGPNVGQGDTSTTIRVFDTACATTGTGGGISFAGYFSGTSSIINTFSYIKGGKENSTAGDYASYLSFGTRVNGGGVTERMRITSGGIACFACQVCAPAAIFTGCVGIGITSPSYKLDVYSSTTATQNIANFAAANYGSPSSRTIIQIGTQYEDGSSRIASVNTTGNQSALIFQSHAATSGVWNDAMYITGGGEVGIGTTNPTYRLEVCGGSSQVSSFVKHINGDGINTSFVNLCSNGYSSYIYIGSSPGLDWKLGKNVLNTSTCTYFQIVDSSNNLRLQINADGNVGIGTASPAYKLDVNGNIGAGFYAGQCMTLSSWSSNSGLILNYGNASGQVTAINIRANGITNGYIGMQMVDSSNGDLWLGGASGRSMTLYRTGNTGFKTDTPCTGVHVEGGYGSRWGGNSCFFGGGVSGGGFPYGDIYGNGASYTYQTACTTATSDALFGGYAAGYFKGGGGGNYGGGGAGVLAIGGDGANSEGVNSGGGAGLFARGGKNGAGSAHSYAGWFDGGDVVIRCGKFGINNTNPTALFEAGKVCENTTAGGLVFNTLSVADSNWVCFYQPVANWAGLMTMHWVAPNDHNRSGAAQIRWSYQACSAALGPTTSIFNDSQNATATFRYAGGWLQACITGAGAGYSIQFTILGARGG